VSRYQSTCDEVIAGLEEVGAHRVDAGRCGVPENQATLNRNIGQACRSKQLGQPTRVASVGASPVKKFLQAAMHAAI
jgi:hypothetical protein